MTYFAWKYIYLTEYFSNLHGVCLVWVQLDITGTQRISLDITCVPGIACFIFTFCATRLGQNAKVKQAIPNSISISTIA